MNRKEIIIETLAKLVELRCDSAAFCEFYAAMNKDLNAKISVAEYEAYREYLNKIITSFNIIDENIKKLVQE